MSLIIYYIYVLFNDAKTWDIVVGYTEYATGWIFDNVFESLKGTTDISLPQKVQTCTLTHPASYSRALFLLEKRRRGIKLAT
jgi:hypothetical protein